MARLPDVTPKQIVDALIRFGFQEISMRGSHKKLKFEDRVVIVPMHRRIGKGLFKSILRQSGLSVDEFIKLLNK